MKIKQLTKERAIQVILNRFYKIERTWENSRARQKQLLELRSFLAALEKEDAENNPFLTRLHRHIHQDMSLEHLWTLMVPVEREFSRSNIVDEDFLVTSIDSNEQQPANSMPVTAVLNNLRSSFNIGGIFRSSDCVGIEQLILCGYTATPDSEKVQKSAMGTENNVLWKKMRSIESAINSLNQDSINIYALETVKDAPSPGDITLKFPAAILVGNERFGFESDLLAEVDTVINIPTYGRKNSLNVVSAFSVCAYEFRRQWEMNG